MTGGRHPGDAAAGPFLHLHLPAGDTQTEVMYVCM